MGRMRNRRRPNRANDRNDDKEHFVVNFDDEDDADGKRTADNDDDSPTNR
jgi:hypothetical protein